jgi:RNA polymerase sigma-70 factor, ECF subfamily
VAIAELHGPVRGLAALAEIEPEHLDNYQPYHAARADLLGRAGRHDDAAAA